MTDLQHRQRERAQWLAEHVLPHEPWLRRWFVRHGTKSMEPDDFVQECYVRLLRAGSVAHVGNAQAYLARTARSVVLDCHRRARIVEFECVADFDLSGFAGDEVPQDEIHDARERLARVSAAIDALPPERRQVVVLRRFDELPQRATAERMQLSESAIEKYLRWALIELRAAANGEPRGAVAVAA